MEYYLFQISVTYDWGVTEACWPAVPAPRRASSKYKYRAGPGYFGYRALPRAIIIIAPKFIGAENVTLKFMALFFLAAKKIWALFFLAAKKSGRYLYGAAKNLGAIDMAALAAN